MASGCASLTLASVRVLLIAALKVSADCGVNNLFGMAAGCEILLALVERGSKLIGMGSSSESSRSQWQAGTKDMLMFVTMHVVAISKIGELDGVSAPACAGSK